MTWTTENLQRHILHLFETSVLSVAAVLTLAVVVCGGGLLLIQNNLPAPDALMKTLPFRLSFPFESTDRPKLKMDLHFLDFPDSFLLTAGQKCV